MATSEPDPFEHYGEQEASWTAIHKHREHLLARAKRFFAQTQDPVGGLVLCAGSLLCRAFAEAEPSERRPDWQHQDCVTVMPHCDFQRFVQKFAPNLMPHVPEPDPPWTKTERSLPVLVVTTHGSRLACLHFDAE